MGADICPACGSGITSEAGHIACAACGEGVWLNPAPDVADTTGNELPPAPVSFPVRPFVPGVGGEPSDMGVIAVMGLCAALILSAVCFFVGSFLWLVLVFPIIHGIGIGGAVGFLGRFTRARLPVHLAIVAAGCAVASVCMVHCFEYLAFTPPPGVRPLGFWEFMNLRAEAGVHIGRVTGNDKGSNLGYAGSIIYWVVEIAITALAASGAAEGMVRTPFCEACGDWKRKKSFGPFGLDLFAATQAVAAGRPSEAVVRARGDDKVTIEVHSCPHCGDEGEIDVRTSGMRAEGRDFRSTSVFVTYPGAAASEFREICRRCRQDKLDPKG